MSRVVTILPQSCKLSGVKPCNLEKMDFKFAVFFQSQFPFYCNPVFLSSGQLMTDPVREDIQLVLVSGFFGGEIAIIDLWKAKFQ